MKIRVSAQIHPQHASMPELIQAAKEAENLGVDCVFTWDHFFPLYGVPGAPFGESFGPTTEGHPLRGQHFEAWTLLTAFACHTKRVELGVLVTCNSYRNPSLLADIARTTDHVSGGRVILGVGSGWYDKDYQEYGYEFGTAESRLKDLGKSLPIIQERLGQLSPPPMRAKLPVLIGGGGEKVTLKLTAMYADIWNFFGEPEQMAHKNKVLDDWCAKVGRDPAAIERSLLINSVHHKFSTDTLNAYVESGVTHFILGMGTPFDFASLTEILDWRANRA